MAASRRNRYSRSTTGLNAIGFFASQVAYTAAATYSAFVTSAATVANNGQMGVFQYPALTLQSGGSNLSAGDRFFIAQIVDGDIKKTPILTYDSLAISYASNSPTSAVASFTVRKTAYSAPVLQSVTLGYNGTSGDLGMTAGTVAAPLTYSVSARDTSPSTQPFPVQSGTIKSTVSSASKLEMASALASDFSNAVDYEKSSDIMFCTCDLRTNGTVTNLGTRTATVVNGSTLVTFDAAHGLVASTAAYIQFVATGFFYKVVAIPSTTTMTLDRPYQGASFTTAAGGTSFITVANLATATLVGLNFTSIVEDTTFVLSYSSLPITIPPTVVTAWKQGSGAPWQVADMEKDTQVLSGFTNANAPFVQDMGQPTLFVTSPETSAAQYTTYFCRFRNSTESMAYANETAASYGYIIIACPNGTSPDTQISKILTNV